MMKNGYSKNQLIADGYIVNLKGFIWIQGESDLNNNNYENDLNSLISYVRNNLANNPNMYVLLGVDEQYPGMMNSPVLLAHNTIANNDENIIFTSMLALPKADATHLTASGTIVQGKRIYDGLKCLENGTVNCFENERAYSISSVGNSISYNRINWGQSFIPSQKGVLREIRFNAATNINSPFTLTIRRGLDCSAPIIHTQTINNITNGENIITLSSPKNVINDQPYYFNIKSNSNRYWKIRYSTQNNVNGNLRTHRRRDANICDYNFLNYDWDFNVFIEVITPLIQRIAQDKFEEKKDEKKRRKINLYLS